MKTSRNGPAFLPPHWIHKESYFTVQYYTYYSQPNSKFKVKWTHNKWSQIAKRSATELQYVNQTTEQQTLLSSKKSEVRSPYISYKMLKLTIFCKLILKRRKFKCRIKLPPPTKTWKNKKRKRVRKNALLYKLT